MDSSQNIDIPEPLIVLSNIKRIINKYRIKTLRQLNNLLK